MIDKEFLQGCTDEQINAGVAWLKVKLEFDMSRMNTLQFLLCNSRLIKPRPCCTNPNDAWPIILENKIAIDPLNTGVKWIALEASWSKTGIEAENGNPLRAAMEVYLLMSNEK